MTPTPSSPARIFNALTGYQRTAALRAAIELDLFTALDEGKRTAAEVAEYCGASPRGVRILCDYLTILGFAEKREDRYHATNESAAFLSRRSPHYCGGALEFLLSRAITDAFSSLTAAVRKGGTMLPEHGTLAPEHPAWVSFAKGMKGMMELPSIMVADLIDRAPSEPLEVLDVAAGHGLFGISVARRFPKSRITALDWPNVLEVVRTHAEEAGVGARFRGLAGSAFDVEWGQDLDVILLPNFLHHFSLSECETLAKRAFEALKPGGVAITVEFIPNEDRVSPPEAGAFSLTMLASTPEGDAYTFREYTEAFERAGFQRNELRELPPSVHRAVISER
jgi:ubiquinone/menaquinone biosynthesis C-methylase UbiE